MSDLVPRASSATPVGVVVSPRARRSLQRIEARALLRSAEIQGMAYVGQTALRGVAEVSMAEDELAKLCQPGVRLRLSAIGDAVTAAIQGRVLDLGGGL